MEILIFTDLEAESRSVKEQLTLLNIQLQFERHRREAHAERNRRLLGKSRTNRALEEHNSALVCLLMSKIIFFQSISKLCMVG
jgi:tuberous sclerosis protein 1